MTFMRSVDRVDRRWRRNADYLKDTPPHYRCSLAIQASLFPMFREARPVMELGSGGANTFEGMEIIDEADLIWWRRPGRSNRGKI